MRAQLNKDLGSLFEMYFAFGFPLQRGQSLDNESAEQHKPGAKADRTQADRSDDRLSGLDGSAGLTAPIGLIRCKVSNVFAHSQLDEHIGTVASQSVSRNSSTLSIVSAPAKKCSSHIRRQLSPRTLSCPATSVKDPLIN